jgi:hypothetical protein
MGKVRKCMWRIRWGGREAGRREERMKGLGGMGRREKGGRNEAKK